MNAKLLKKELKKSADLNKAKILKKFFKTKKGEYGHGDVFFGVTVLKQRKIIKNYKEIPLPEINKLLKDKIHECRFSALIILIEKYRKEENEKIKNKIVKIYLNNLKHINNWDLVDISAPYILGDFFLKNNKNKKILKKLVYSDNLWERRMAIISTFAFIRKNEFNETFQIAKIFLKDKHDLIHKATGWMLREVGKRDKKALIDFLEIYSNKMPRTMLRYSIEKLNKREKIKYLKS